MKDYYKILGVDRNASQDEIKKAYRRLAHKYHPDKSHGGDEAKFKEINEAYQVLGDENKRRQYDQFGQTFDQGGQGFDFRNFGFDASQEINFEEIFKDFFGGFENIRSWGHRQKRGKDIAIDLEISFKESVFGTLRQVILRKNNICQRCGGSGGEPGKGEDTCPICHGSGTIRHTRKSFIGILTNLRECDRCFGRGVIPKQNCKTCRGYGILKEEKDINVAIPSGIEDGEVIKLSGEGEAIKGGVPGDLYIRVHVKPHPVFRKEGKHLLMNLEISFTEAALGTEKKIETLDGDVLLKIPAGIDSGEVLTIKNKGVAVDGRTRGDLIIQIFVRTPKRMSRRAKELFEKLKEEGI